MQERDALESMSNLVRPLIACCSVSRLCKEHSP